MNFRTWSARAGFTHLPKIVGIAEALNSIHRHANLIMPNLFGLVVTFVNGYPKLIAVKAKDLSY